MRSVHIVNSRLNNPSNGLAGGQLIPFHFSFLSSGMHFLEATQITVMISHRIGEEGQGRDLCFIGHNRGVSMTTGWMPASAERGPLISN